MPQHDSNTLLCHDCKGFATVVVTTGARHADGTRATLPADCATCKGTGTTPTTRKQKVGA